MLTSPQTFSETDFWCMAQSQQMFCLFPSALKTFRVLGLQGLYPSGTFSGIDKINLALWGHWDMSSTQFSGCTAHLKE